jgi:hypothetical protein
MAAGLGLAAVIASEAKQSSSQKPLDCLVACAPRNDGYRSNPAYAANALVKFINPTPVAHGSTAS